MSTEEIQTPAISVVVPAFNAAEYLKRCLEAVFTSNDLFYQCIVVDDGSTDESASIAQQAGARVLHVSDGPLGPAHARNRGVEAASGPIVFFVDADVVLAPGALCRVVQSFQEQPDLAAVFGSYDARPAAPGVISQYRNLLHHFVHQNSNSDASTFWAGCGAVRRNIFDKIGGFDEKRFSQPSIEDIELGYRLREAGYRILLDKQLQGTHLKRWSFFSLIRTDIRCRAIPWSRLILETKNLPDDLNLKLGQRICFALVAAACVVTAMSAFHSELLVLSALAFVGMATINRELYGFFFRQRGIWFALLCIPLHFVYYLYSGTSYLWVWLHFRLKRVVAS
jgi:GT2 family glycosyltransferase